MPSPDAVQEVRVATSTYDAQFGRTGGGTIAVSIRSGTNQFHGTAYYIHRDAALNANLYENIVRGIPKQEIFHYNPGATIGGPIKRDRTFFFYSYEGLKSGIPVGAGQRTPTELERNGDFSQSGFTIYDPLNTVNGVPQPFAGNIIPRGRMDPVALNMLNYMPGANSQPDAAGNNFFPGENSRFDTYTSGILRIDHNLSASHRLFGRYAHNGRRETRAYAGREPEARTGGYHHRWNNVLSVDLTSTLSQTTVSTLRAGWTRHRRLDNSTAEDIGGFDSSTLGYPGVLRVADPASGSCRSPSPTMAARSWGRAAARMASPTITTSQGQVTNIRGRHQLKAGVEYRTARSLVENPYRGVDLGAFNFTRSFTSLRPTVATPPPPTAAMPSPRSCSATSPCRPAQQSGSSPGSAQLAELVRRRIPPGRLAAVEPADRESGAALGLRGADQRARGPGQRRVRLQRRRAGLPGLSRVRTSDGAARRPHVRRRRDLLVGPEQLRAARRLHVPGERCDRRAQEAMG